MENREKVQTLDLQVDFPGYRQMSISFLLPQAAGVVAESREVTSQGNSGARQWLGASLADPLVQKGSLEESIISKHTRRTLPWEETALSE